MKKYVTHKNIALLLLFVVFLFSNLIPPAGIAGGNFYEYTSGGFIPADSGFSMEFFYKSIPAEGYYSGSLNWFLRPLSMIFPGVDIRVTGSLLFLFVFLMFAAVTYKLQFKKTLHAVLFEFLFVIVFGDIAYLLHFNTMTTQGLYLCLILIMTLIAVWQYFIKPSAVFSIVYYALCIILGGLSEGWFLLGVFFALLLIPTLFLEKDRKYLISTVSGCALSIIMVLVLFSGGVSAQIKKENIINSVFYGIYKDDEFINAENKKIPSELKEKYSGKAIFEIDEDIELPLGYNDIFMHYVKNLSLLKSKTVSAANNAFEIRAGYVANKPDGSLKKGFMLYSALKRRFLHPGVLFVFALTLGLAVFCGINIKSEKNIKLKCYYVYLIILAIVGLYAFFAPIIISGDYAIAENMFLFNIIFDVLLLNAVVGGMIIASDRRDRLKEKYGVNQ